MKKLLLFLFIFSFMLVSCKKDNPDSRDVYVGRYFVHESVNCYGPCDTCSTERDTSISVTYGSTDTTLMVLGREVWLDTGGTFYAYHYGLEFRDDSIFSNYMNGGLGCGQYESYKGVKTSNTP